MPKKSQCTWHEGCTSYIYAPTNVCSILVPTSLKSSVGKDSIKYKTVHATVLLIQNIVHPHCLSIIIFLLDFLFKHTQKINTERSMVIFLSEQYTVILGLLLLLKLSVPPENKSVLFNCTTLTLLAETHLILQGR